MNEDAPAKRGPPRWQRVLMWAVPIVAWIAFSIPARDPGEDGAYFAGRITGGAAAALALALFVRLLYWLVRRRRRPFWSYWVFVIAATIALLARAGEAAG